MCNGSDTYDFAVARLGDDGTLDTTFNSDGKQTVWFIGDAHEYAQDVEVRPDGKVVLGGRTECGPGGTASVYDFALARLNQDGSPDTTFDTDGKVTTDFGSVSGTGPYDPTYSIVLMGDGRVTAAGVTREQGSFNDNFALARYLPNGSLDASFNPTGNPAGTIVTDFGSTRSDTGYSIALLPGGRAVVAGTSAGDFAIARYGERLYARYSVTSARQDPDVSGDSAGRCFRKSLTM